MLGNEDGRYCQLRGKGKSCEGGCEIRVKMMSLTVKG